MNDKNTAITIVTMVIVAVGLIGGIIYYASLNQEPSVVVLTDGDSRNSESGVSEPNAPTVATIETSFPDATTAVVTGTVNPNGALTNYWYEYGSTSDLGSKTVSQMIGSGFVKFNAPGFITSLTKSTTYYFQLVAENQYGKVIGNMYSFKTASVGAVVTGSAPFVKTLPASGISKNTVNINGEVTPNKVVTEYWFEYGKTANLGSNTEFSSVGEGSVKVPVSISLSGLDSITTYYFRINAQNKYGTVNGAIQNFKTI
jgi:hypothetical protein